MKRSSRTVRVLTVFMMVLGFIFAGIAAAQPASARLNTIVWNSHGDYVPMYVAPNPYAVPVDQWTKNGEHFQMICWTDFKSYTGNYTSVRWFYGMMYDTAATGYVHSSYVYYQTNVPRC